MIYRQFSVTIVSAMVLSVLTALIFTPGALRHDSRRPSKKGTRKEKRGLFGLFNRTFNRANRGYERGVQHIIGWTPLYLIVYVLIVGAMAWMYLRVPSSFLPDEDQGIMFVQVTCPVGATIDRTSAVLDQIREYFTTKEKANVQGVFTVVGFNFGGRGQSSGLAFVRLKPWSERPGTQNRVQAIAGRAMSYFGTIKDAMAFAFAPPSVIELGNATGFDFELLDRGNVGHLKLMEARNKLLALAGKDPALYAVRPNGLNDEPQFRFDIDREKVGAFRLTIADVNNTLSAAWGSAYVNDFVDRGRIKKVFIQGDAPSRMLPQDFDSWYVRNSLGEMVPFSAFAKGSWTYGSPKLERYDGVPSIEIQGAPAPGLSTGTAMAAMEKLAAQLPPASRMIGPAFPSRKSGRARRPGRSTPFRWRWSSFALPRSTKAGRSRSRSCSWCRSAFSARFWRRSGAGCPTTSSSRWDC